MEIKIFNESTNKLPFYATSQAAGMDIYANLEKELIIYPNERVLVPTGLHIALPDGYEAQIRPRSGLALKHGITVLNSPGTIDADYRGEIGIILINHGSQPFTILPKEKVAQMVITKYEQIKWQEVKDKELLEATERGDGGFGHTGR